MERLVGIGGIAAVFAIAWGMSCNRKGIKIKPVLVGFLLQLAFALAVLRLPFVREGFQVFAEGAKSLVGLSSKGAGFLFGFYENGELMEGKARVVNKTGEAAGGAEIGRMVIVQMLPPIIFFSAFTSLLYYFGILQRIVQAMAYVMTRFMGVSGCEALSAASNTVVGMTAAPLVIRPHVARLTQSELFAVMAGGFATSAGAMMALYISLGIPAEFVIAASVMSAPAALAIAKVILPETGESETGSTVRVSCEKKDSNAIEAIASGTTIGLKLALNVAAMLISFLAMIALVNAVLGWIHDDLTLQRILGWVFSPLAFLMGVPFEEASGLGELLGIKISTNEVVAFSTLKGWIAEGEISARAKAIASFALCGFSNFGSIGIQIGGLSAIAPERRKDLSRWGLRAMFAGALASCLTASIAGIIV